MPWPCTLADREADLPAKLSPDAARYKMRTIMHLNMGGGKGITVSQILDTEGLPLPITLQRGVETPGFVIEGVTFEDTTRLFDVLEHPRVFPNWAGVVAYWPVFLKARAAKEVNL